MKLFLLSVLLVLVSAERLDSPSFNEFISIHGKEYETEAEHNYRYWTFYRNMAKWTLLNRLERGTATYGMNMFSDITEEEFATNYLSKMGLEGIKLVRTLPMAEDVTSATPASWEWNNKNVVTGVKNQGSCGSCWAFSTTGNLEGQNAIATKTLLSLSEQELVDCDKVDLGCNGGLPYQAYAEIMRLGGLVTEADYPYKGVDGTCKLNTSQIVVEVTGREQVSTDEEQIAAYVAAKGPVSVGINAFAMQFYTGGISHPFSFLCSPSGIDHGVLITGYGTDNGTPFWNIKNSWGASWGEKGYYRLYRGAGCCGINKMVTSGKV